jgi:hypothetical protein
MATFDGCGRGHFTDGDVSDVTALAMAGLVQTADSAALRPHNLSQDFIYSYARAVIP